MTSNKTKRIILTIEDYFNSNNDDDKTNANILEIKTSETRAIKQLFKKLKNLTYCANINFVAPNPTGGIMINNLTDDRSVFIKIKLDADKFEKFYCKDKIVKAGVNILEFNCILKKLNDNEPITFYMNNDSKNILYIKGTINDTTNGKTQMDEKLYLLDLGDINMPIPKTEFQNKITIDSGKLHNICNLCDSHQFITIITHGNEIIFKANSDSQIIHLSMKDINFDSGKEPLHIEGMYEIYELKNFSKCDKLCSTIDIYHKKDFPLVLHIPITILGNMYVFIAPVVESIDAK